MKKIFLIAAFMLSGFIFLGAKAQLRISVRANIGVQPIWGPVGYNHAEYYYLPDIDVFYHIPMHQYIFMQNGRWIFSTNLPRQYRDFDLYSSYKVVVNQRNPYLNARYYRTQYSSYKGRHDQGVIRNSRERKYFENKSHPQHHRWKAPNQRNRR
jgi:hypothetical protein